MITFEIVGIFQKELPIKSAESCLEAARRIFQNVLTNKVTYGLATISHLFNNNILVTHQN